MTLTIWVAGSRGTAHGFIRRVDAPVGVEYSVLDQGVDLGRIHEPSGNATGSGRIQWRQALKPTPALGVPHSNALTARWSLVLSPLNDSAAHPIGPPRTTMTRPAFLSTVGPLT